MSRVTCRWDWCSQKFDNNVLLEDHLVKEHVRKAQPMTPLEYEAWLRSEGYGETLSQNFPEIQSSSEQNDHNDQSTNFARLASPTSTGPSSPGLPGSPALHSLIQARAIADTEPDDYGASRARLVNKMRRDQPWQSSNASSLEDSREVEQQLTQSSGAGYGPSPTTSYLISTQEDSGNDILRRHTQVLSLYKQPLGPASSRRSISPLPEGSLAETSGLHVPSRDLEEGLPGHEACSPSSKHSTRRFLSGSLHLIDSQNSSEEVSSQPQITWSQLSDRSLPSLGLLTQAPYHSQG